jgi:signal transduction histidine kinase
VPALVVALVGALVGPADWYVVELGSAASAISLVLLTAMLVVAPWALGMWSRTRRAYVDSLIDRGERLEREAAQQAELAASDERARIAREMHDVVAHGLSVIIVQADGARYAAKSSPEAAERALETIAASGREALGEMRRMLGLLRSDDTETGVRPQPGLADLDFLVEQSQASGMPLRAHLEHPLPDVSSGVGLTVYRVVQEALTNVRKHAGPAARADLVVRHVPGQAGGPAGDGAIEIVVEDDGRGAAALDDGSGHGLLGMRERVAVHGGDVEAGPRAGGGYRVHAQVPLGAIGETP